jgi:hypothetical protein
LLFLIVFSHGLFQKKDYNGGIIVTRWHLSRKTITIANIHVHFAACLEKRLSLMGAFKEMFRQLQKGGVLEDMLFFKGCYLWK